MNVQKKPAARLGQRAVGRTELHKASYTKATTLSRNLKEQIGEILLSLQKPLSQAEQQICWQDFESMLRRYADLRIAGGGDQ